MASSGLVIVAGTYGIIETFSIVNADGSPYNLTNLNVTLNVSTIEQPSVILFSRAVTVSNPTNGIVQYTVQQGDFPNPGTFYGQFAITSATVNDLTLPFIISCVQSV
jgi:hypothetical protein